MTTHYTQYEFMTRDEDQRELLISILPDLGFEGFEEAHDSLRAFAPQQQVDNQQLLQLLEDFSLTDIAYHTHHIAPRNWNEEWEKNFEPVTIANQVHIRAPFHLKSNSQYDIVIEPKMSFGTGHHPTTSLMIEWMLDEDMEGKTILDFGCGTGILAILASLRGATHILAIDNEDWACENSRENAAVNSCSNIDVRQSQDTSSITGCYDIILANINRHIIIQYLPAWQKLLVEKGTLVVSGLLQADQGIVVTHAEECGLNVSSVKQQDGWILIVFKNNK